MSDLTLTDNSIYQAFAEVVSCDYQQGNKIVLALSGGVDSRLLLALLAQYRDQYNASFTANQNSSNNKQLLCEAVYVHHGLSQQADFWAEQCMTWSQAVDIVCHVERVELDTTSGNSLEQLARDARYQALAKHIQTDDLLLTGQHSDDQLETFLLALKRGSGPKGLSSMAQVMPFVSGKIVRPLLHIPRKNIEQLATQLQLQWVEDESNQDQRFDRNFLRHEITSRLTERWPSIRQSVQRSASLCAQQEQLLDLLLNPLFEQAYIPSDGSLSIQALTQQPELVRERLLRMWLGEQGVMMPSHAQQGLIWSQVACAKQDANPQLQLKTGQIRRFNQCLYWVDNKADITQWQQPIVLNLPLLLPEKLGSLFLTNDTAHPNIALMNDVQEYSIGFNPEGLVAHPETRGHSRKLKKLFQEYNVPSWLRRQTPILMYKNQVVAVADLFVDREFSGQDCELIWRKS